MPNPSCWQKLLKDARKSDRGFEALVNVLNPLLYGKARKIASQCVDDAVQSAIIKIWRNLDKIDENRQDTIKALMMRMAIQAMRDEIRRVLRRRREVGFEDEIMKLFKEKEKREERWDFTGILGVYYQYVKDSGTFVGAHKHVSEILGMNMSNASVKFHKESKIFTEKYGLTKNEKESIFNRILNETLGGDRH